MGLYWQQNFVHNSTLVYFKEKMCARAKERIQKESTKSPEVPLIFIPLPLVLRSFYTLSPIRSPPPIHAKSLKWKSVHSTKDSFYTPTHAETSV